MIHDFDGREKCCDNWYNSKTKLEWYLNHPEYLDHKQVLLEGMRTTGVKWKIVCDEGIKDLMYKLNSLDFYTIYSCEGNEYGGTYIMIRYPKTKKKYKEYLDVLKNYFNDSILCVKEEDKLLIVYIWTKEQRENNFEYFKKAMKLFNNIEYGVNYK